MLAEVRQVAQTHPSARKLLCGSTALTTGVANALKPLSERSCWPENFESAAAASLDAATVKVAEAMLWLLGWLLPTSQNAAVLHVRGDAAILLRFARLGGSRELRRAAMAAFTLLHLADGASDDVSAATKMLVEAAAQCESPLAARLSSATSTSLPADPRHEAAWQTALTLAALCRLLDGRSMSHADGPAVYAARAPPATRHDAREAFLHAGGIGVCSRLVCALGGAFGQDAAVAATGSGAAAAGGVAVATAGNTLATPSTETRRAEALWLLRAATRTLGCVMRDDAAIALRGWQQLGRVDGLVTIVTSTGILTTGHAAPALSAVLELATGVGAGDAVAAAGVVLRLLPSLPEPSHSLRLVDDIHRLACRSELAAIALAKSGADRVAWHLLTTGWPARTSVSAGAHRALRHALVRLVVRLARSWSLPQQFREMVQAALPEAGAAPNHAGIRGGVLSPSRMALLVACCRPAGPSMPYVWLTPRGGGGQRAVQVDVQERAWPPAHAYTVGCWVRRPLPASTSAACVSGDGGAADTAAMAEAAAAAGDDEPFALFELETTDERSYTAAFVREVNSTTVELTVQAGSTTRLARCRVEMAFVQGVWHWLCVVHERKRPLPSSQVSVYLDGTIIHRGPLTYPTFDCCHTLSARLGYDPTPPPAAPSPVHSPSAGGDVGTVMDDAVGNNADDGGVAAAARRGWHLGPAFGAEMMLSDAHVREACGMAWAAPFITTLAAEAHSDELKHEGLACWRQSALSPNAATDGVVTSSSPPQAGEANELRIPPAKTFFLVHTLGDDASASTASSAAAIPTSPAPHAIRTAAAMRTDSIDDDAASPSPLIQPRRLAQLLPAAGGAACLLRLVQHAHEPRSLLLALALVRHCLSAAPMNMHLFGDAGLFGLRLALRAKPDGVLTEEVCDQLIGMCCKEPPSFAVPATVGGVTSDALDAALEQIACDEQMNSTLADASTTGSARDDETAALGALLTPPGGVLANTRMLRIVLLDTTLWSAVPTKVQRHWLQRLHDLLTEDATGASNAKSLVVAGVLDCATGLIRSGGLAASGGHLLATRLVLRVWHSVEYSLDVTARVQDLIADTCQPVYADVQLLCLRMLSKMVAHARAILDEHDSPAARAKRVRAAPPLNVDLGSDATPGEHSPSSRTAAAMSEIPHDGARAVVTALQPPLLLAMLHCAATPRAVVLVVRLLVQLLLLSSRFPEAVAFGRSFREARGFERLSVLLPPHAAVADMYLSLMALALGRAPGAVEKEPPPETPHELADSCAALLKSCRASATPAVGGALPLSEWASASLGLIALISRDGMQANSVTPLAPPPSAASVVATPTAATPTAESPAPAPAADGDDPIDIGDDGDGGVLVAAPEPASPAAAPATSASPSTPSVPFVEVLHLVLKLLPSLLTVHTSDGLVDFALREGAAFAEALGSVWLFARLASESSVNDAGGAPPSPSEDLTASAPSAAIDTLAALTCSLILDTPAKLSGTSGSAHLELLLDPLPSLTRSGTPFSTWFAFRSSLLHAVLTRLHTGLAARAEPLSEHHARVLGLLYKQMLRLQAVALFPSTKHTSTASSGGGSAGGGLAPAHHDCEALLPHSELLSVALILVERGVGSDGGSLIGRAAAVGAVVGATSKEAMSNLVSWGRGFMNRAKDGATPPPPAETPRKSSLTRSSSASDGHAVLGLALRILSTRFLALDYLAALSAAAQPEAPVAVASHPPMTAVLPILGDVAMVLTTLASDTDASATERADLETHRPIVLALAWRLLSLFTHPDRDVQRGAISQWVALMAAAKWLERAVFAEHPLVFDWQPLHASHLAPSSYVSWVEAHYDSEAAKLLDGTIGSYGREEEEYMRGEADSWVSALTKEQMTRASGEESWQKSRKAEMVEVSTSARSVREGSTRAIERRQRAVRSAESARDAEHGRARKLAMGTYELARAAFVAEEEADAGKAVCVLRRRVDWALNTGCVSEHGTRRKLERVVTAAASQSEIVAAGGYSNAVESEPCSPPARSGARDTPASPTTPSQAAERLSVLLDCAQLRSAADAYAVAHVHGLDAAPALLAVMPGCIALLYGYELGDNDTGGFATARPRAKLAASLSVPRSPQSERYRRISNAEIAEVARRRYQLQPWALQLLLHDGETILLAVSAGEAARDKLCARLAALVPKSTSTADGHTTADGAPRGGVAASASSWTGLGSDTYALTDAWQRGAASNFEYLMQINSLSGRCFDDLMQYPVVPWVLREYEKPLINLRATASFRDLRKPMGAQTETRAGHFARRFEEWDDGDSTADGVNGPFHYGTHYSSAAAVSSYLIRLEPFSSLHCALQDGRFDLADRLFHSVCEEWKLASGEKGGDTGCVKELVPELFYLWEVPRAGRPPKPTEAHRSPPKPTEAHGSPRKPTSRPPKPPRDLLSLWLHESTRPPLSPQPSPASIR